MNARPPRDMEAASATSSRPFPVRDLWWLALGFGLWFSALVFVYALHHVGCTFGWSANMIRLSLVVTLLVHLAAIGFLWRVETRRGANPAFGLTGSFMHWAIVGTLVAALVKIVFTLGPVLFLSVCL